jgi:hypothetical protein
MKDARMLKEVRAAIFILAVAGASCSGPTDPSKNKAETLTGTVQPLGQDVPRPFNIPNTGEFSVRLTAFTPGNVAMGVIWGQYNGGCSIIQNTAVTNAQVGRTILSGSILLKGDYCVAVFDPSSSLGTQPWTAAQTYTLEVSHP